MMQRDAGNRTAADYLIASKRCDIHDLEQLLGTGRLVVAVSNLIHALQRERGAANVYLASGGGRFARDLPGLRQAALKQERQFRERLARIDPGAGYMPGASRLYSRVAYAIQGLDELRTVREEVRCLRLDSESVVDGYSQLIHGLLAVVFEAADSAVDPDISRLLVAMFHLMQGKEFAGRERAIGAGAFARGDFGERLTERLRHLIENQERCFQIFASFADDRSLATWHRIGAAEASSEFERLRRMACTAAPGQSADPDRADRWFEEASRRIDGLKQVEDQLESSLEDLCARKLEAARDDLDSHEHHLEALAEKPDERAAFAVFFDGGSAAVDPATYTTDVARPQLGRSLVDLVQSQSVRLQRMSEELDQARTALAERKTVERAKGLVMEHRGMTEEEAYRFLRQVAMAQSRPLAEVASDTVAMVDLLKDG